jgi:hypothetical protein
MRSLLGAVDHQRAAKRHTDGAECFLLGPKIQYSERLIHFGGTHATAEGRLTDGLAAVAW